MILLHLGDSVDGLPIVARIDATRYVAYVLAAELGYDNAPVEALKAQCVAILSYALNINRSRPLKITQQDQVYDVRKEPSERHNRIAQEMAGIVGTNRYGDIGQPARMQYHASCGGHTDQSGHVCKAVACPCGFKRNGHGWGMCQRGALRLARDGWGWREIVEHYYDVGGL